MATTLRRFSTDDLFIFNQINLDKQWTETYACSFYLTYLAREPDLFVCECSPGGEIEGYLMAKCEGVGELWHSHVTAITVAPEYRRLGVAKRLMRYLELHSEAKKCYFIDLFVRKSNLKAINMYELMGFVKYREIIDYYSSKGPVDAENAYDMRKAMSRDVAKKSVVPLPKPVTVDSLEWI